MATDGIGGMKRFMMAMGGFLAALLVAVLMIYLIPVIGGAIADAGKDVSESNITNNTIDSLQDDTQTLSTDSMNVLIVVVSLLIVFALIALVVYLIKSTQGVTRGGGKGGL